MTNTPNSTPQDKTRTYTRDLGNGVTLEAQVSPCVFMYDRYPLQVTVRLLRHPGDQLGDAYAVDRELTAQTYSDTHVRSLLDAVRVAPCTRCATPAFDSATVETNRGGLCEACFLGDLRAELAEAQKAEQRALAARDRRMKREGMAVRVTAWIHPEAGGDDYEIDWYFKTRPTRKQVADLLRQRGSACLDDYQIIPL